jgi:hypothetical protein
MCYPQDGKFVAMQLLQNLVPFGGGTEKARILRQQERANVSATQLWRTTLTGRSEVGTRYSAKPP